MNYLGDVKSEQSHTFEAVRKLLGFYVDEKYLHYTISSLVDFDVVNTVDILMLAVMSSKKQFLFNKFVKTAFYGDLQKESLFRQNVQTVRSFGDLVELILVLQMLFEVPTTTEEHEGRQNALLGLYKGQMEKVTELQATCGNLIHLIKQLQTELTYCVVNGKTEPLRVENNLRKTTLLSNEIKQLQVKTVSKKGLVACISMFIL